ncbi:MAG: hypothetical protein JWQ07_2427 [Ramlibacter sp.]|nr:hypothetical protein [Ramlibacter sp.]
MALQLRYDALPGLMKVEVSGEASLGDLIALIDALSKQTLHSGHTRALVNLQGVKEGLKFTDHFSIGDEVARKLGHLDKLASVVPTERRTGTSEKVANAQGMRLRVFVSEEAALEWLNEP